MTSEELRKQHIIKFKQLPSEERLDWAISTGRSIRESLSDIARKRFDSFRLKQKKERNERLERIVRKIIAK